MLKRYKNKLILDMLVNEEKKDIFAEQRLVDSITKYTAFITQL